jgi:hypothetical protein
MHIEVTPAGKFVGKVLRRFLRAILFAIPLSLIVILLFYGVQCTRNIANTVFRASAHPSSMVIVTQPPRRAVAVPSSPDAPTPTAINNSHPSIPVIAALPPVGNGGGIADVAGSPPTRNPATQDVMIENVVQQPVQPSYASDAETEYVMFWYFGDVPRHLAEVHSWRPDPVTTTQPETSTDRSDPKQSTPPKAMLTDTVASASPQQHTSSTTAVSPTGRQQTVPRDRQAAAQTAAPDIRRSQSSTSHTQNPSVARGSPSDRSTVNSGNRGQAAPSRKGLPPFSGNQQRSGSDNRRGRSNDPGGGR